MKAIQSICDSLAGSACEAKGMDSKTGEVISYGLYLLIADTLKTAIFVLTAYILGILPYASFSLLCFGILRIFAGGIHAKTWSGCLISSTFTLLAVSYLSIFIGSHLKNALIINVSIFIICLAILVLYAPSDHRNKPIVSRVHRKRLKILSVTALSLFFTSSLLLPNPYSTIIMISALAECIFILPVVYKITKNGYGDEYELCSE